MLPTSPMAALSALLPEESTAGSRRWWSFWKRVLPASFVQTVEVTWDDASAAFIGPRVVF